MTNPIQPKTTQYIKYQNSYISGQCKSAESVLVTWSSGFAQPVTAKHWDSREFSDNGANARLLSGAEEEQAKAFFAQLKPRSKMGM